MDETLPQAKARLRRDVLARRDALSLVRRIEASIAIADHAAAILGSDRYRVLGGYLPIRSEVDPRPLMALAGDRRLRLCVPAIVGAALEFRALEQGAPLEPQAHGTHAPGAGAERLRPDVLLVPLAAFDRSCQRIGYGGGFYDRAIAELRAVGTPPLTIGLAFAAQEIEHVPAEPFDISLDMIVTEAGIVRPSIRPERAPQAADTRS